MQDMDPRLSPPGGPVSGGEMIIFEGHLEKISDILSVRMHAICCNSCMQCNNYSAVRMS